MSDSDRSGLGQAGLAIAALSAVIFGGGLWYSAFLQEAEYQATAERDAEQKANSTRESVLLECTVAELPSAECAQRIQQQTNSAQQETYDLEAQRIMAVWTRAMGIAAIIGMSVGILGLGLIFFTFRETRKGAQTARDNLAAFYESERAIVHAINGKVGKSDKREGEFVAFEFKNRGRAPARIVSIGGNPASGAEDADNVAPRWTIVPVNGSVLVTAFPVPPKNAILETECWVNYRSVGPKVYTSYFHVVVSWRREASSSVVYVAPTWRVKVSNSHGHPNDT